MFILKMIKININFVILKMVNSPITTKILPDTILSCKLHLLLFIFMSKCSHPVKNILRITDTVMIEDLNLSILSILYLKIKWWYWYCLKIDDYFLFLSYKPYLCNKRKNCKNREECEESLSGWSGK